jgi:hypothetical protein
LLSCRKAELSASMIGVSALWFIVGETNRASKINRPRVLTEMKMRLFKDYTTLVYAFNYMG